MNSFDARLSAFEARSDADIVSLEALQKVNAVKKEIIANLKEELENHKNEEASRQKKRDEAEKKGIELSNDIVVNFAQAKSLSTQMESLDKERVSQIKTDEEVRSKLSDYRKRVSNIIENQVKLTDEIADLKQPVVLESELTSEIYSMAGAITKEITTRRDAFDMTALVAEVQAIESMRNDRLRLTTDLTEKTEMLTALDADNASLQMHLEELQSKLSEFNLQANEATNIWKANKEQLEELTTKITRFEEEIEGVSRELAELDKKIAEETQHQKELEQQCKSIAIELVEKKEQCRQEEKTLIELQNDLEKENTEFAVKLQDMEKSYEARFQEMKVQQERCQAALEEAAAEVEKMEQFEKFLKEYQESCDQVRKEQENLSVLQCENEDLRKKIQAKEEKTAKEHEKLAGLRRDVNSKKRDMEKDLENAKAMMKELYDELEKAEREAVAVQNKGYEIEGEICLVKHQVLVASEKLTVAKNEYFLMKELNEAKTARQFETKDERSVKERKRKKGEAIRIAKECGQAKPQRATIQRGERYMHRATPRNKGEKDHQKDRNVESKHVGKTQPPSKNNVAQAENPSGSGTCQSQATTDTEKSASLQHTDTLASTLADELKRVERSTTVDLDDSMMEEDDAGDLFSLSGERADTPFPTDVVGSKDLQHDIVKTKQPTLDSEIYFEPSELFTSTPLIVKKECTVRPTRVKSANRSSQDPRIVQSSTEMPPFRMRSGENAQGAVAEKTRRRKKNKKKPY